MKRLLCLLSALLSLCLLSACAQEACGGLIPDGTPLPGRVVRLYEDSLLLAGSEGGVYTASPTEETLAGLREGDLVTLYYSGVILETFPAQLGQVEVVADPTGFDDLCVLYRQVLEDLWGEDAALNDGITQLGVDLSQSGLSQSEQSALAWAFAGDQGLPAIEGTWQELADQGYIDGENLYWEDGVLFSIRAEQDAGEPGLVVTAEKWRSGTGAYFFCDCTSTQDKHGHWSDYTVGAFAIS